MNRTDTVLIAVDLLPSCEGTIKEARRVAEALDAELVLLHAVPVPTMPEFGDDTLGDRERAETRCRERAAELAQEGARVRLDPIVEVGCLSDVLLKAARAHPTALVVLGSGSKTKLERLLLGSNVETLLGECPRPVWIVHASERRAISRLLVAVDTSRPTGEALKAGAFLARKFGARLDLMCVFPESAKRAASLPKQQDDLRRYAADVDLDGVEVEYVAWEGEPGARIVEAASARDSDLLVLGAAGRRGIYRWLKLPLGEQVARALPCSLLSVPLSADPKA